MDIKVRTMTSKDWEAVADIYRQGILTGNATFQSDVGTYEEWDKGHLLLGRIVADVNEEIAGWGALSKVSERCVYGGVAEVSVYIHSNYQNLGIGTMILDQLVSLSESGGVWTLQAGIFPENIASLKLHEKLGFRIVGTREKMGQMKGVWRDVVLLERRSKLVGF